MAVIEGKLTANGLKFAVVVSRFNTLVTEQLLAGAKDCFIRHGGDEADLTVVWVPGACEIPQVAKKLSEGKKYQAIVTLGAVIRGATPHFDQVVATATRGVADVAMHSGIPVLYGVLTTDNLEQALERAGTKGGNKGWDVTLAAIEMANLWKQLK
jgi:6,7-dimethyl-8-ribityllumazine synthase